MLARAHNTLDFLPAVALAGGSWPRPLAKAVERPSSFTLLYNCTSVLVVCYSNPAPASRLASTPLLYVRLFIILCVEIAEFCRRFRCMEWTRSDFDRAVVWRDGVCWTRSALWCVFLMVFSAFLEWFLCWESLFLFLDEVCLHYIENTWSFCCRIPKS